jgi:hypothetical protein
MSQSPDSNYPDNELTTELSYDAVLNALELSQKRYNEALARLHLELLNMQALQTLVTVNDDGVTFTLNAEVREQN